MVFYVYGISDCPACLRACADLMESDREYVFINCDFSKSYRNSIREQLNWATFPVIICDTNEEKSLIGGSEELKRHLEALSDD